jgi:hypothetical protein
LKSGVPRCGIGVFAMPADEAVAKIEDLHQLGLDYAASGAHQALFMAEYDYRVATDDELLRGEFLKLERVWGKGFTL